MKESYMPLNEAPNIDCRLRQPQELNGYVFRFVGECFWCDRKTYQEVHSPSLPEQHFEVAARPQHSGRLWFAGQPEVQLGVDQLTLAKWRKSPGIEDTQIELGRPVLGPYYGFEEYIGVWYSEFSKERGIPLPYDENEHYTYLEALLDDLGERGELALIDIFGQQYLIDHMLKNDPSNSDEAVVKAVRALSDELNETPMFAWSERERTAPYLVFCFDCAERHWTARDKRNLVRSVRADGIKENAKASWVVHCGKAEVEEGANLHLPDGLSEAEVERLLAFCSGAGVSNPLQSETVQDKIEEFALVWNSASSPKEAALKLGITQGSASTRASRYKKMGLDLKSFRKNSGRKPTNVAGINRKLEQERD